MMRVEKDPVKINEKLCWFWNHQKQVLTNCFSTLQINAQQNGYPDHPRRINNWDNNCKKKKTGIQQTKKNIKTWHSFICGSDAKHFSQKTKETSSKLAKAITDSAQQCAKTRWWSNFTDCCCSFYSNWNATAVFSCKKQLLKSIISFSLAYWILLFQWRFVTWFLDGTSQAQCYGVGNPSCIYSYFFDLLRLWQKGSREDLRTQGQQKNMQIPPKKFGKNLKKKQFFANCGRKFFLGVEQEFFSRFVKTAFYLFWGTFWCNVYLKKIAFCAVCVKKIQTSAQIFRHSCRNSILQVHRNILRFQKKYELVHSGLKFSGVKKST